MSQPVRKFGDDDVTNPHAIVPSDKVNMLAMFNTIARLPEKTAEKTAGILGRRRSDRVVAVLSIVNTIVLLFMAAVLLFLAWKAER